MKFRIPIVAIDRVGCWIGAEKTFYREPMSTKILFATDLKRGGGVLFFPKLCVQRSENNNNMIIIAKSTLLHARRYLFTDCYCSAHTRDSTTEEWLSASSAEIKIRLDAITISGATAVLPWLRPLTLLRGFPPSLQCRRGAVNGLFYIIFFFFQISCLSVAEQTNREKYYTLLLRCAPVIKIRSQRIVCFFELELCYGNSTRTRRKFRKETLRTFRIIRCMYIVYTVRLDVCFKYVFFFFFWRKTVKQDSAARLGLLIFSDDKRHNYLRIIT